MAMTFRYALRTHLGTVRSNNEDSALGSPHVLLLADGMGGHAAGEVASAVAMRVFAELVHDQPDDAGAAGALITRAGRSTRRALHQMSEADPVLESMGTTFLAVVSHGDDVTVGHIGDSRVYALRGGSLFQVTTDHTHVQRLVDTGQLTAEKARTHPYRAMLLRSLDDQPTGPDLDLIDVELTPGDRLLLCSDGLSDYLSPEHIGELLGSGDLDETAEALVDAALRVGTRDNVTVVVADVVAEVPGQVGGPGSGGSSRPGGGTAPRYAGAVVDQITLSPDAADALATALPDLEDPLAPPDEIVAGSDALVDDALAELASDEPPAADPRTGTDDDDSTADVAGPAGERSADERRPVAGSVSEPVLPGVLAAVLVALVVVAMALVL